ncbi:MAG: efflux RND transporter periplasmic adaptor subunit [Deltaproteobacteria bacterium]|nr:efflux RND transporter periplasmic adaptor subunit [Deltaproteobacteria bacterium]
MVWLDRSQQRVGARALLAAVVLSACPRAVDAPSAPVAPAAPPAAHDGKHADEHEGLPTRVRLSAAAHDEAAVRTEPVTAGQLGPTVDITGEVMADPDHVARVTARVAARVREVRFREGDLVKQGAVLVVLESAELARARAAWTSADARARGARASAERAAAAFREGLVPVQQVAVAESDATALEADALAARQVLGAFGAVRAQAPEEAALAYVAAPISGRVVARDAVLGQGVAPDHVLATVVDMQRVFFQGRLFEKNLADVQPGRAADVRLNAYPSEVFAGRVEAVGHQVDPTARTFVARIALTNRGDLLKLGLFGTARIVVDRPAAGPQVLAVPLSAVTRVAGRDVVFVAHPGGDYEVHPVTLGQSAAGRVEIIEGLRAGETVVVEGVFSLKSLVLKSTFGEEE